jgi:hypothetical protein
MLLYLLLKELADLTFGDDLHHVLLSCRPVETMHDKAP